MLIMAEPHIPLYQSLMDFFLHRFEHFLLPHFLLKKQVHLLSAILILVLNCEQLMPNLVIRMVINHMPLDF